MHEPIIVPRLNENDDDVQLVEFLVSGGKHVERDDPLFLVETSKAIVEITAEREGYVHWLTDAGREVPMPSTIGLIGDSLEELRQVAATLESDLPAASAASGGRHGEGPTATRAARELAADLGVELQHIAVHGIIRESHVRELAGLAPGGRTPSPSSLSDTRPRPTSSTEEAEPPGKVDEVFLSQLRESPEEFGQLPSDEKVSLYRKHGALMGDNIQLGKGTVLDAQFIELGNDTVLREGIQVRCRRFSIGQLGVVGDDCRFFCRDFLAGDVVTIRWNVAIVDGQGGIHDCRVGDLTFIGYDCYLNTDRDVSVGERVCLAPGVRVYTHRKWLDATDGYPFAYAPVVISDRCWLGPVSMVLPGVTLGEGVTLMAHAVAVNNAPAGALLAGSPATVILADQKAQVSSDRLSQILTEILGGSADTLERQGWALSPEHRDGCVWAGRIHNDAESALILVAESGGASELLDPEERIVLVLKGRGDRVELRPGITVFDLQTKQVRGNRDAVSDAVRNLFYDRYGVLFEPRLWRHGCRIHETSY